MVELICLVDIKNVYKPCHDTVMYLNQAYSVLYQSTSQSKAVFCNMDLELPVKCF